LIDLLLLGNQITTIDVSKNTNLVVLQLGFNKLTAIDVSKNTALEDLRVHQNQLTKIDVSNCLTLEYLHVRSNPLTTIDVSKNTALKTLSVWDTQLTTLDVSKNTHLEWLDVRDCQLTILDVSNNPVLEWLNASNNQLTSVILNAVAPYWFIDLSFNNMTSESAVTGRDIKWDGIDFIFSPRIIVDSVANGIKEALDSENPLVLAPGANTNITAADLEAIKASGGVLDIVLPNGLHISINADDIGANPNPINLNIAVTPVTTATNITGTRVQAPANSLVIEPAAHGQFGFTLEIHISAERLAAAGLTGGFNLYYVNSAGVVTNYGAVTLNANGSATIAITHASLYVLSATPPVIAPAPPGAAQMGDYRTLLLPGLLIAMGLLGLGGWVYLNKRNKKAAK
jgi:hypothetical protein